MEENFRMEWNMEENFRMEWKVFDMEWKKIASMEYGKIVFHSNPYHTLPPTRYTLQRNTASIMKYLIR